MCLEKFQNVLFYTASKVHYLPKLHGLFMWKLETPELCYYYYHIQYVYTSTKCIEKVFSKINRKYYRTMQYTITFLLN